MDSLSTCRTGHTSAQVFEQHPSHWVAWFINWELSLTVIPKEDIDHNVDFCVFACWSTACRWRSLYQLITFRQNSHMVSQWIWNVSGTLVFRKLLFTSIGIEKQEQHNPRLSNMHTYTSYVRADHHNSNARLPSTLHGCMNILSNWHIHSINSCKIHNFCLFKYILGMSIILDRAWHSFKRRALASACSVSRVPVTPSNDTTSKHNVMWPKICAYLRC